MPRKVENVIGKKFGKLLVLENLGFKKHGSTVHKCLCDCGNIKEVPLSYLKSNHTRSCGCFTKETHTTHNLSKTRVYEIYYGIYKRCLNPNSEAYKNYGGRGITVCDEWLGENGFINFYNWSMANGYKDNLTIDRINVNENYCPENCRWIEKGEQSKNTRRNKFFTYENQTKTISEWSREKNIPITTLLRRIKQKRPTEEIFYKGDLKCQKK